MASQGKSRIILIGAGAHGRVALDVARQANMHVSGFLDDVPELQNSTVNGVPVLGTIETWLSVVGKYGRLVLCIGSNLARFRILRQHNIPDGRLTNVIHPSAIIFPTARMGVGVTMFTHTHVGANAIVGSHVIINNGVSIDHDCVIDDYAALSPGATIAGRVTIEQGAFLSVGVVVAPRKKIGSWSIIGAGSTVVDDIPTGVLAYGSPARVIRAVSDQDWTRIS